MLRLALVSGIVLQLMVAAVGGAASVRIDGAKVTSVKDAAQLAKLCGINLPIDACTTFRDFEFKATCNASGQRWMIATTVHITPRMILLAPDAMRHEFLHINDVQKSTWQYLRELEGKRYLARQDCDQVAAVETAIFGQNLRSWVDESNAFRDHGRRRGHR